MVMDALEIDFNSANEMLLKFGSVRKAINQKN